MHLLLFITMGLTIPHKATASFYETSDKSGYKISYRDGPLDWANLQRLFSVLGESKNGQPELLCVTGVWLIYPNPGYNAADNETVKLITGKDKCINSSDVGTIGAMQPLIPSTVTSDSNIVLFSSNNFKSIAQAISEAECEMRGLKQLDRITHIGSIIVTGEKPWSLISTDGRAICVRPQGQHLSICYEPNLIQIEDFRVDAVFPNCPDETDTSVIANFKLVNCKQYDSGNLEALNAIARRGRSSDNALECRYNITWNSTKFTEEESALISKLLSIRLTHDFERTEQILWPDARVDIWKTGPLDTAFDIMIATVPEDVINVKFLLMVREFSVYHLNEVWKEQRETGEMHESLNNWRNHQVLVYLMNKCLQISTKHKDRYIETIKTSFEERRSLEDFKDQINHNLVLDPTADPIIEIAYVVSNYAMALCHNLFEYKVNFWTSFITTFGHLYFRPLQKRWKSPTISPKTFGVILSGFGIEAQHRRISYATTRMLELTPKLEPFEKSPEVNP